MNNSVNLRFSNTITKLAGYPYGLSIYQTQVKGIIDIMQPCTIVFPNHIERVASSFVQGFFAEIINEIGYQRIENNITLVTSSQELTDDIWNKLI